MSATLPSQAIFSESPYAAELGRGTGQRRFGPRLEGEYARSRLREDRTLIRAASLVAVVLAAFRATEQLLGGAWLPAPLLGIMAVLVLSLVLAFAAWSPIFDRAYLPLARILVPARNAIAAAFIAAAAAYGQREMLMILPLMVLGPFFFLGLEFRAAVWSVASAYAAFAVTWAMFEIDPAATIRTAVILLVTAIACALAALQRDRWSRRSFLEGRLITELAEHDALTGLKNRRMFDEHLEQFWLKAVDEQATIAILLIDIDHFKEFNDLYGHQAGDQTLRRVAQTLQSFASRPRDMLARYGGEEFAVVLFDIGSDDASAIARSMCTAVRALGIEHRDSPVAPCVTVSVGAAILDPVDDERRARGALQLADQALYEAKMRGRNRVELTDTAAHSLLETGVFEKCTLAVG